MADSGIITMEEYGIVRLKLKERMDNEGINRHTLARKIGVRVLHCTVGDLLEYHR